MSLFVSNAEDAMRRALKLAERGIGLVEPNPAVGAVIINEDGRILGEGWHERFGGPHAEVMALQQAGTAARGATLVVTLEPCCHFGQTPPCTQSVLQAAIRRVIVATIDPATHARGLGIAELRAGGVEVDVGLCAVEAQKLIAPFQKLLVTGRPWVHAKWAMTLDGKIASTSGNSQWISNEASRLVVHRLRGRMDAILVGLGTVIADDPLLTVRPPGQRVPTRIVLDSTAQTPLKSQLGCTARSVPTMLVVTRSAPRQRCVALAATGAEILVISEDSNGHPDLRVLLAELGRRRMTNVLVEGGGQVLGGCFDQAVVDEVHAFIAPKVIGGSTAPSPVAGIGWPEMSDAISLEELSVEMLRGDLYLRGRIARNVERTGS